MSPNADLELADVFLDCASRRVELDDGIDVRVVFGNFPEVRSFGVFVDRLVDVVQMAAQTRLEFATAGHAANSSDAVPHVGLWLGVSNSARKMKSPFISTARRINAK